MRIRINPTFATILDDSRTVVVQHVRTIELVTSTGLREVPVEQLCVVERKETPIDNTRLSWGRLLLVWGILIFTMYYIATHPLE